jgi:hypothetical protein
MDGDQFATREEVTQAVRALSDEDHQKLILISRFWHRNRRLSRLGVDAEELLSEAYSRTLAGQRRWRKSRVGFVKHLDRTMESISGHWLEEAETMAAAKAEVRGAAVTVARRHAPTTFTPETVAIARMEIDALRERFAEDPQAWRVLERRAGGGTADEIQTELSLTKVEYETISRRILRTFTKYSLRG